MSKELVHKIKIGKRINIPWFFNKKTEVATEETKKNVYGDKYELTKTVKVADVKAYLLKEFERSEASEKTIEKLEEEIVRLKKIETVYNNLLVIDEKKEERYDRQDKKIEQLKETIREKDEEIKLGQTKATNIKINAENKLKEKDEIIKELKAELKKLASKKKGKK